MNHTIPAQSEVQAVLDTLTPLQKQFLIECRNYEDAEQQRSDNFSNAGKKEAAELFTGDRKARLHAAGGLISSLTNKGLGSLDTEFDQFWLSDLGIEVACSL